MTERGVSPILFYSKGEKLLGALYLARGDSPKPTAVLLHGIPGIEKNYDLALALRDAGWNALVFHYRGCWGSGGRYNFHGIPEDVRAAVEALSGDGYAQVDPAQVALVGHSLGGWAAVLSAAADPRIRAVASIAGIHDPETMPFDDPGYAAYYTPWLTGITPNELAEQWRSLDKTLNPLAQAARLAPRPLLLVHSAADEVVPVENSRRLAALAAGHCRAIEHPNADHSFTWHRRWLIDTVIGWLKETQ